MGKAGRRKRRQREGQRAQEAELITASRIAVDREAYQRLHWLERQKGGTQALAVLGVIAAGVGGHFLLWGAVYPALGEAVGRVPVVSTVTGWLFGGGAFLAWGVLGINHDTAKPGTVRRLRVVAWSWTLVALAGIPTGYANGVSLPVDFWAGVYASGYGVIATPVVAGVTALGWWLLVAKLFRHKKEPSHQATGWICVGYAVLLLVWGSTLLRM